MRVSWPRPQDVINLIDHGGIPLVSIKPNGLGGLGTKVMKAIVKSNYFTVSRVWSVVSETQARMLCPNARLGGFMTSGAPLGTDKGT